MKLSKFFIIVSFAATFFLSTAHLFAAQSVNLLVMGEDVDEDTVPRDSRVFSRVIHQMQEVLNNKGFNVKDETAVTLGKFGQGRTRRTDAELIDIAKSVPETPIDVVVIFQIFASAEKLPYTTKIRTRVAGRMLQPHSGNVLGSFEVDPSDPIVAHPDCNRECLLESVGKHAKVLGDQVAGVLGKKLNHLKGGGSKAASPSGASSPGASSSVAVGKKDGTDAPKGMADTYHLTFSSFDPDEMEKIEQYLAIFSGYQSHRPIKIQGRQSEYEYISYIAPEKLNRNFYKMLLEMKVEANVDFSGNKYKVEKIEFRQERPTQQRSDW